MRNIACTGRVMSAEHAQLVQSAPDLPALYCYHTATRHVALSLPLLFVEKQVILVYS